MEVEMEGQQQQDLPVVAAEDVTAEAVDVEAEGEEAEAEAEAEGDEEAKPSKRAPRKRKRRAMDAHLLGMSEEEIAAYKASVLGEYEGAAGGSGPPKRSSARDLATAEPSPEPEDDLEDPSKAVSPNKLPDDFHVAFPMMCLRGFDVELLERDLEGTNPGSYVGEVISRLMYTLTKDSRLAGDNTKDKPWLIRLRREFIRRDPKHNKLGDGPISLEEYWDDEEPVPRSKQGSHVPPSVDDSNVKSELATPQPEGPAQASSTSLAPPGQNGSATSATTPGNVTPAVKTETDEKPVLLPHEWTESYGWEDLTIKEQIYALWSITEWQLQNAEKFRNNLTKYRVTEEEHVTWRIEPIGRDADFNVYWLFDDNRLWIERETPRKKELRLVAEQTDAITAYKRKQREKRILRQQKERMWALHERRRQRTAAKKAAEEALDREIAAMDATQRAEALANGKGKRKREDSDVEDPDADAGAHVRSSSRLGQARLAERMANRPPPRRSTRGGESSSAMQLDGDEDWQKIPPEWLKSEDQEKDEDPDFGADGDVKAEEAGNESDLSGVDEEDDLTDVLNGHTRRTSSRRSPRKTVNMDEDKDNLSDLSDLSDAHPSEDSDGEDAPPTNVTGEVYAQSAYNMGPSYDSEDDELPEGFVRYEAICTNLDEWTAFDERFGDTEDAKEIALLDFVRDQVIPGVTAGYAAKEAERQKKIAQRKAQLRKERQKAQQAALAAERAAERAAGNSSTNGGRGQQSSRTRSSRNPKKELTEEEKREQALSERVNYSEKNLFANVMSGRSTRAGSENGEGRAYEIDRRALRAKQREEEKRQKEEAEMLKELEEAEGELEPAVADGETVQDIAVPDIQVDASAVDQAALANGQPQGEVQEDAEMDPSDEYLPPGQAGELVYEDTDYRLDCSVCRRRGMNLDANQKLVGCDMCDRWEHVVCHRKAAEKAGLPKPDFENEDFVCEDCQMIDDSVIVPAAPKRARSDKQLAGAIKGAEKRKAKFEARRKEKAKTQKQQVAAVAEAASPSVAGSAQSPPSSSTKASAKPKSRTASSSKKGKKAAIASTAPEDTSMVDQAQPVMQPQQPQQPVQQLPPAPVGGSNYIPYYDHRAHQLPPQTAANNVSVLYTQQQPDFHGLASHVALPSTLAQSASPLQSMNDLLPVGSASMSNQPEGSIPGLYEQKPNAAMPSLRDQLAVPNGEAAKSGQQQQQLPDIDPSLM